MEVAGERGVSVQLAGQSAKAWARLKDRRQVEVALERGRNILESLSRSPNPDHHFEIDPAKWHFYAMDAYHHVGENELALTYADEVLRIGVSTNGEERSPMRNAEARITRGIVAARIGDIDEAIEQGHAAWHGARRSLPTLRMVGTELAAEVTHKVGAQDPRVSDLLDELSTTARPTPTGTAL